MISDSKTVSQGGRLILQNLRRRSHHFIAIALLFVLILCLYPFHSTITLTNTRGSLQTDPLDPSQPPAPSIARQIPARDLLSRPVSPSLTTTLPKIIHQTWFPARSNMSDDAQAWVQTIRQHHPDWEYVLWDDETNELLVRKHFPWFLETYLALPKEINRADMARNFYMYLFGGMYADVDTEALRPVDTLFAAHEVPLAPHLDALSSSSSSHTQSQGKKSIQRAFMGRMAHTLDAEGLGAVPNGWMASPPGHPFWLLPVLAVLENPQGDGSVEGMTGPGILGPLIKRYYSKYGRGSLRRQLCRRIQEMPGYGGWGLFCPDFESEDHDGFGEVGHSLVLLPRELVYPFSWVDDGEIKSCLGTESNEAFDPERCKREVDVEAWPSYFITYCSHTW